MTVPTISFTHKFPITIYGFATITPPSIKSLTEKFIVNDTPIEFSSLRTEGIIYRMFHHQPLFSEHFLLRAIHRIRPYRNHQVSILFVNRIGQCLRIGIMTTVHLGISPSLRPIVPVLYNYINRNTTLTELIQRTEDIM